MIGAMRDVLFLVLQLYQWIVIFAVIASWLVNFGVINLHNQFARMVVTALYALTEPVFSRIRRVLPPFGGLDLSPLVVLIVIFFLQSWLYRGTLL